MEIEKYKNKGLSGLANLGNTCFLNSAMQVLSHTYELNDFLDSNTFEKHLKNKFDSLLFIEWNNLRKQLWNENCIISPNKFISTFQKVAKVKGQELFTGFSQNDLPEFLIFIIDCFHNSISREVSMKIEGTSKDETDKLAIKCYETIKQMYENCYKTRFLFISYCSIFDLIYLLAIELLSVPLAIEFSISLIYILL